MANMAQNFISGMKGAFLSETPAVGYAMNAISKFEKTGKENTKVQQKSNVINLDMARSLKSINSAILDQRRIAANAAKRAEQEAAFAEEVERERVLRDEKLLNEIKKLREAIEKMSGGAKGADGKDSILGFLGGLAGLIPRGISGLMRGIRGLPAIFSGITDAFKNIKIPNVKGIYDDLFSKIFAPFKDIKLPKTAELFSEIFNKLFGSFKNLNFADEFAKNSPFKGSLDNLFKGVEDFFNKNVYNKALITFAVVGDKFDEIVNTFKQSKIGGVVDEIGTFFKGVGDSFNTNVYNKALLTYATIGDKFDEIVNTFKQSKIGGVVDEIGGAIKQAFSGIGDLFKAGDVAGDVAKVGGGIGFISSFFKGISDALGSSLKFVGEVLDITPVLKTAVKVLGPISAIFSIFDGLELAFSDEKLKGILGKDTVGVADRVSGFIGGFVGGFFDIIDLVAKLMGITVQGKPFGEAAREFVTKAAKGIFDDLGNLFAAIGTIFTSEPMKYIYGVVGDLLKTGLNVAVDGFRSVIQLITGIISLDFSLVKKAGSDLVSTIATGIGNVFKIVGNVLIDSINWLINELPDWVKPDSLTKKGGFTGFKKFEITDTSSSSSSTQSQQSSAQQRPTKASDWAYSVFTGKTTLDNVPPNLVKDVDDILNERGYTIPKVWYDERNKLQNKGTSTAGAGRGSMGMPRAVESPGVNVGTAKPYTEADLRGLGLNLKVGDVQKPGAALSPALVDLAQNVQSTIPGVTFTGFNDRYHQEKASRSLHTQGLAFDFVIPPKDATNDEYRASIAEAIGKTGARVIDEYAYPSAHSTGGHFHVNLPRNGGGGVDRGSGKFGGGTGGGTRSLGGGGGPSINLAPVASAAEEDRPQTDVSNDPIMQTAVLNTAAAEAARAVSGSGFVGEDDSVARRQLAEMQLQTELAKKNNALTAKAVTTAQQGNQIAVKKSKDDLRNDYYIQQLTDQTKRFTNSTSNFFFDAMKRTLGPFGFGAARNALEGPGELGNLIGGRLNITKKITPFLQNIVGKRAGSEYAQIFGQIGNVFIDKFANQVGKGLGFTDTDQFGFGQILSNLMTGGTKEQKKAGRRMGLEQLLYNFTGIPTGSSTLLPFLNKQFPSLFNLAGMQAGPGGLFSPEQLMRGLANYGGQMVGGPFTQGVFGAFNGMNNGLNRVVSYDGLKVPLRDANVLTVQEGFTYDSWETATNQQEGFFNQLGTGLTKVFTNVGDGLETVLGNLLGGGVGGLGTILTSGFNLLASLFGSGGLGGGGTGLGGGGGFFEDLGKAWSGEMSWGDALLNTGMKVGGNLLTNYAAYKITKGIDNPYVRLAAQQGANYLIKSGLQVGAGALGYGDVASKFLGKDTGLTTAFKTGDFSNLNPFKTGGPSGYGPGEVGLAGPGTNITTPGGIGISTAYNDFGNLSTATTDLTGYIEPGTTSIFGNASGLLSGVDAADVAMSAVLESGGALSSAGAAAASVGDAAALGMDAAATAGTSVLGDLAASAGEILPYAGAIIKLFQGDIVGAAGSALGGYLGTFLTPWLGPLGPIVGSFLGSFLGGGKADPRVTWAIYVNGNNDPTGGGIISQGKKTPEAMRTGATKIGIMLFAMAKKVQLTLGGGPLAYDYFALELHGKAKTAFLFVGKGEVKPHGDKEIWKAPIEDISKSDVFSSMADALLTAMTEQTAADKAKTAKASVSTLTKPELETGEVIGAGKEVKNIAGTSFANRFAAGFREFVAASSSGSDENYSYDPGQSRQVYNEQLGKIVDEENQLIFGYNKEGKAVDLQGNVVDFSKYSTAAAFTGSTAVKEAYKEDYIGSGEDGGGTNYYARKVFNVKTGKYQDEENLNVVGYDREGKAVTNNSTQTNVATPITNGATLTLAAVQQQNEELKNSNPSTATANAGGTAVINSGNVNNNQSTVINNASSSSERKYFGTVSSEFSYAFSPVTP